MDNSIVNFLMNDSLYSRFTINDDNIAEVFELFSGGIPVNAYCLECASERVFHSERVLIANNNGSDDEYIVDDNRIEYVYRSLNVRFPGEWNWPRLINDLKLNSLSIEFSCAMDVSHRIIVSVVFKDSDIIKVGQYPSIADLSFPVLKKYEKVLSKDYLGDFKRGIGLHAHGIGAGSYVYLRRVFEKLVDEAEINAINEHPEYKELLLNARMSERIKVLKDYLPPFIVNNESIYKILSKGIHDLSEDDCNNYYDVLYNSLIMILDEKKAEKEKRANEERLKRSLNDISSLL